MQAQRQLTTSDDKLCLLKKVFVEQLDLCVILCENERCGLRLDTWQRGVDTQPKVTGFHCKIVTAVLQLGYPHVAARLFNLPM